MNFLNFRSVLAYLIPGFTPIVFTLLLAKPLFHEIKSFTVAEFTIFIISGVTLGLLIDLFKQLFEKPFVIWCNLTIFKVFFKRILGVDETKKPNWTLRQQFEDYELKLKETIKFWIDIQIEKKELGDKIQKSEIIRKEYYETLITVGDRWALLNILEKDSLDYIIQEYHTYYQFSFNTFISIGITIILSSTFYFQNMIDHTVFWVTLPILSILFVFLQERAIFWLLAIRRFSRKIILYSILKD
jgi:hypothetical protein